MIEIKDIEFGYRSKNILHNISFDMNEGHCIAILGVNGAGKSTLIKCLNRMQFYWAENHTSNGMLQSKIKKLLTK